MNNEERDNMLIEIRGSVKVTESEIKGIGKTLYGNSKPGLVKDVTLLQERQDKCPARQATTIQGKRLTLATIVALIGILSLIVSVLVIIL